MASIINSKIFKNRKKVDKGTLQKLIVKDDTITKMEVVRSWGYGDDDKIAIPTICINEDGTIRGTKWTVLGNITKRVSIKTTSIWMDTEDEQDMYISLEVPELDKFTFHNQGRNVSDWIDSSELSWNVTKKKGRKQEEMSDSHIYEKGFSIRMGVLPISIDTANLTLSILPLAKNYIKKIFADQFNKVYCPQLALTLGDRNVKAIGIKLGIQEKEGQYGMGILPIIQDNRSDEQIMEYFPSSLEIRKTMADFLRECQGFNNKIPRTLQEALAAGPYNLVAIEPEFLWPEAHKEESDLPLKNPGKYPLILV